MVDVVLAVLVLLTGALSACAPRHDQAVGARSEALGGEIRPGGATAHDGAPVTGEVAAGPDGATIGTGGTPAALPDGAVLPSAADQPIEAAPDHFDGRPPPAEPAPAAIGAAAQGATPGPGTWAVVIGIDDYPGSDHDLRSAVADAEEVVRALMAEGVPGDHILLLRNGQVSQDVVGRAIDWMTARASDESVGVFFYAGHVRKLSSRTEAIVTADGGVVRDTTVADHLRSLRSKRSWIVVAACFGGGFDEVLAPGRILTAAADANHLAYETSAFNRSYLVEFLIRQAILMRQADTSIQAAFQYAVSTIAQAYPGREPVQYELAPAAILALPFPGTGRTAPAPPPSTTPASADPAPTTTQPRRPTTTTTTTRPACLLGLC